MQYCKKIHKMQTHNFVAVLLILGTTSLHNLPVQCITASESKKIAKTAPNEDWRGRTTLFRPILRHYSTRFFLFGNIVCPGPKYFVSDGILMQIDKGPEQSHPLESAKNAGYHIETHTIYTRSDYILTYYRIPRGKKPRPDLLNSSGKKYPVLIVHGIAQTSADWLVMGEKYSLPFILADLGYDVWLGNIRGNEHTPAHKTLSRFDAKFWDFSFHEMADEDIPAAIDYILEKTSQPVIHYIGYSLGSSTFITSMALHPENNKKVGMHISLAPVVFTQFARSLLLKFANLPGILEYMEALRQKYSALFDENDGFSPKTSLGEYCTRDATSATICFLILYAVSGVDVVNRDDVTTTQQQYMEMFKGRPTTSLKLVIHFMQISKAKRFQMYDNGAQNMATYGKSYPPIYPLYKCTVPTAIVWCEQDFVSDPEDVATISNTLPHVFDLYRVPSNNFSHVAYLYRTDSVDLVYKHILDLLDQTDSLVHHSA